MSVDIRASEEVEMLYDGYIATPLGAGIAEILLKTDKVFSNNNHREEIMKFKKEVLVQLVHFITTKAFYDIPDASMPYTQL